MISKKAHMIFNDICGAAQTNELCLVECTDRKTGKKVNVVCFAVTEGGSVQLHPLARLFSGNPHNEVAPPGVTSPKLI